MWPRLRRGYIVVSQLPCTRRVLKRMHPSVGWVRAAVRCSGMTRVLHELTMFAAGLDWFDPQPDDRLVHTFTSNDPDHLPRFYKQYGDDLPRVQLAGTMPPLPAASGVLAGTATVPGRPVGLAAVSPLLYLSAGVTRVMRRHGRDYPMRAAGSAGGRFPLELYLTMPQGVPGDVPAGVHWYHPLDHALVTVGPPPVGADPALVITGLPWRTGWRYRERGFRHLYWDAGTVLSHLLALADALGLRADLYPTFPDAAVGELVGCDGVFEFPLAVLGFGDRPALAASGPAVRGELDDDGVAFPLVVAAQRAGDTGVLGTPLPRGSAVAPIDGVGRLDELLLARSSHRRLDPSRGLPRDAVDGLMRSAMRGVDVPHFVVVNDVAGVMPGLYRWPDLDTPLRAGDLRGELYEASTGQGLPRDASFVVISAIDGSGLSDRGYRDAQLLAGLVMGRLHILAPTVSAGANGMTFDDVLIPALLGDVAVADLVCLLWTCVGVPEYQPKPGGSPSAPTTITMVEPRLDDGPTPPSR